MPRRIRGLLSCLLLGVGACGLIGFGSRSPESGLVAHEWGTFTSVQGGDGALLDWRPLETTRLPKFVYDWTKPGSNRQVTAPGFGKGMFLTLQRMETPVIYFYADNEQTVDVSVRFPRGLITEWYPQARDIGPSTVAPHPALVAADNAVSKTGLKPNFSFASTFGNTGVKESLIHWKNIRVLPAGRGQSAARSIPTDASGSHYFAARETDAAFVRVDSLSRTNPLAEHEKFLFYRGVGSFGTPLQVTMNSNNLVTLTNTGKENLTHLFVLTVQDHQGEYIYLDRLAPGERRAIQFDPGNRKLPLSSLVQQISSQMAESLIKEGLYRREAVAMVNTWQDSWFEEEGVRVLYVLPRAWTDRTLPITVDPQPRELVRVMVGRAEIISPTVQRHLAGELARINAGDPQARAQAQATLKRLGRFAEPALALATRNVAIKPEERVGLVASLRADAGGN